MMKDGAYLSRNSLTFSNRKANQNFCLTFQYILPVSKFRLAITTRQDVQD